MTRNVLYCLSGLPEWVPVAERLQLELGWVPAYWMTQHSKNHDSVRARFPETLAHTFQDANRCILPSEFNDEAGYPLDPSLLSLFMPHQVIAFELMERMDLGRSFSYQERVRTYHRLLVFALKLVERLRIDVAIFNTPPHSVAEYVLYAVCQSRGVPTGIMVTTGISGLVFVGESVDEPASVLRATYQKKLDNLEHIELSSQCRKELDRIRSASLDKRPWYMPIVQGQQARSHSRYEHRVKQQAVRKDERAAVLAAYVKAALDAGTMDENTCVPLWAMEAEFAPVSDKPSAIEDSRTVLNRVFKKHTASLESVLLTRREYKHYRRSVYGKKLEYKALYESLCVDVDVTEKFVYVPLHYQPERTTCPDGGWYSNQWLMVNLLSCSVPSDWLIYVKEHPTQFSFTGNGEQARSADFYADLDAFGNVRLLDLEQDSFELIDRAQVVATVTGMAGWEAVCRGIPCLVFGNAWYALCDGVFRITDAQSCAKALVEIQQGRAVSQRAIDAFVSALEEVSFVGYVNPSNAPAVSVEFERHVQDLTAALKAFGLRHAQFDPPEPVQ